MLTTDNAKTKLEIIQEDNRPGARQEGTNEEDNPIMKGLKQLAEKD